MNALPLRAGAFLVDVCIANIIGGILALPFFFITEDAIRVLIPTTPLLVCFAMMAMSFALYGQTPGKRLMQLDLTGDGCLICRELRRLGWYILLTVTPIVSLIVPVPWFILLPGVLAWIGFAFVMPLVQGNPDFPHNTRTGFQVIKRDDA